MTKTVGPITVSMKGQLGTLVYAEDDHVLRLELEYSGVPHFVLLALTNGSSFATWTSPADTAIPKEKQVEIVLAIRRWEIENKCPISL
jgi:hypothetical protein